MIRECIWEGKENCFKKKKVKKIDSGVDKKKTKINIFSLLNIF